MDQLKSIDRKKLQSWEEYTKNVSQSTPIDKSESSKDKRDRIKRLEADPEQWFKYYFPKYTSKPNGQAIPPAQFHIDASQRVIGNAEWYEVRMWSRECAKSTRTMMETFYITLVGHIIKLDGDRNPLPPAKWYRQRKRNVLMVSNSEDNAIRLLAPYKANLETNNRLINDYGQQENHSYWTSKEMITKPGVAFRALGAGQSPRGSRNEQIRPDVLLVDDIDTDEDCRNPKIIKDRWNWIDEALISTRSVSEDTTIIFCGNRIALDTCVVRASKFADQTDLVNIRDKDGKSTWPAKNPEWRIDRIFAQKSMFAIQKEYFNNPIIEGAVFKQMAYKPAQPLNEYSLLVCYTDPSYKDSEKSDFKATVLIGKWKDEFHVIKAFCKQTTTAEMVDWHYQIMDIVGVCGCYYFMEEVFMQDLFYTEFNKENIARHKAVPITGDQRAKPQKFVRIESTIEPLSRNGKFYLNEEEKSNPHMIALDEQFIAFGPGSRAHDDGPDACEGAIWIINNKEAVMAAGNITLIERKGNTKRY
jgi:hypothetical protein